MNDSVESILAGLGIPQRGVRARQRAQIAPLVADTGAAPAAEVTTIAASGPSGPSLRLSRADSTPERLIVRYFTVDNIVEVEHARRAAARIASIGGETDASIAGFSPGVVYVRLHAHGSTAEIRTDDSRLLLSRTADSVESVWLSPLVVCPEPAMFADWENQCTQPDVASDLSVLREAGVPFAAFAAAALHAFVPGRRNPERGASVAELIAAPLIQSRPVEWFTAASANDRAVAESVAVVEAEDLTHELGSLTDTFEPATPSWREALLGVEKRRAQLQAAYWLLRITGTGESVTALLRDLDEVGRALAIDVPSDDPHGWWRTIHPGAWWSH